MLGTVIMEIGEAEMIAAVQFCLNQSVFGVAFHKEHTASVTSVKQRKGRFVIEFEGQPEPEYQWSAEVGDEQKAEATK